MWHLSRGVTGGEGGEWLCEGLRRPGRAKRAGWVGEGGVTICTVRRRRRRLVLRYCEAGQPQSIQWPAASTIVQTAEQWASELNNLRDNPCPCLQDNFCLVGNQSNPLIGQFAGRRSKVERRGRLHLWKDPWVEKLLRFQKWTNKMSLSLFSYNS